MMKKSIPVILLLFSVSLVSISQDTKGLIDISKVPEPQWHYQKEYTFDSPSDNLIWKKEKPGLNAGFGSSDKLFLRCEVPENIREDDTWKATGWRGQRLNSQILVWSPDSIEQIRIQVSDLKDSKGHKIENKNIDLNLIRYVLSNYPYNGNALNCEGPLDSVWLMPDRFEPFERFDLPGKTVRPIWFTLNIPENTHPGKYLGKIEIISTESTKSLEIEINVQQMVLPSPENWKFRLDLWQNPWVVAWYYHVEPWSDEHVMLLKKHMKLYAGAGGSFITTYAVHSPWSDNSYMIEGGMIEWIKTVDGKWKFDYSVFDQYIKLCMEMGIDEAITIYTPVPWGNRFRYIDEKSGNYIYESWPVDSEEFKTNWIWFLDDLKMHLANNKWLDKTYLGINENPIEVTIASINFIKKHWKDWKITYAGDWHPELSSMLDDYCTVISSEPGMNDIQKRKKEGFTTTYYTCCTPPKPNNFVFSPPVESHYMGWHASSFGYDGFLRWAYDAWPADPLRDARHTLWPAGDCFMVYPGGNSSIRFEKLREGIVDFEKIRIIKNLSSESKNKNVNSLINKLDALLESFKMDTDFNNRVYDPDKLHEEIQQGVKLINQISDTLSK